LAISFFPLGVYAAHTDLDCAAGDAILPIAVVGGVLNLVSVNIARLPVHLDTVNSLMTKHGWHVVLVQEMGIMHDVRVDMEDHIHHQLSNTIHFNSPSALSLWAKQNAIQLTRLNCLLQQGNMLQEQFESKKLMLHNSRVYAAGGMAILVAPLVACYVQVHNAFKHDGPGHLHPNPHLMLLLLSINGKPVCVLNMYALAEGLAKTNRWICNRLNPVIDECYSQGWGIIAMGNFNAALATLDHSNTENFRPCLTLNTLIGTAGCLADSF
jgi:hypothetical protein